MGNKLNLRIFNCSLNMMWNLLNVTEQVLLLLSGNELWLLFHSQMLKIHVTLRVICNYVRQ